MNEWDIAIAKKLAVKEAREEGIATGKAESSKNLFAAGVDIKIIAQCTGLDEATVRSL